MQKANHMGGTVKANDLAPVLYWHLSFWIFTYQVNLINGTVIKAQITTTIDATIQLHRIQKLEYDLSFHIVFLSS